MEQAVADQVVRAWATQPGVKVWSQMTIFGEWDVWVQLPGRRLRIFNTRQSAADYWRRLRDEGVIRR